MTSVPWKRMSSLAFWVATALTAQQPATAPAPRFDVVSIREVPPNAPPAMREQGFTPVLPGGQFINSRTPLLFMIAFAWDVRNPSTQLTGLPDWANSKGFAVSAKPGPDFPSLPPAENYEQVRLMMRAMLAERFHLQLHTETRQQRILQLGVARGGLKIKEVDPPVPPATAGNVFATAGKNGAGRMIGNKSTMERLVTTLTLIMKQPVVDETGLKGNTVHLTTSMHLSISMRRVGWRARGRRL